MKILVVGGGAAGSSFAARMRRLDEKAEIIIFEKTNETSIASCGLPYYIGNVISDRSQMQVASPDFFKKVFNIQVYLNTEIVEINPHQKQIKTQAGDIFEYDKLVLALGAKPVIPPIKGMDQLPCFVLKNLKDADQIKSFIETHKPKTAVVVGGGFVGMEIVENLSELGIKVSLVEQAPQVLMPLDSDMVKIIHKKMKEKGISLYLNDGLKEMNANGVLLQSGREISGEMAVLSIGTRPETELMARAGISLNDRRAVITNEYMQTNFPDIYACGDNVAVQDFVSKDQTVIALAGPANRQGRLIADHIAHINPYPYCGSQGTGIVKVFDLTAAFTGNNEKQLQSKQIEYEKMIIISHSHAGYYPNAESLTLKVLYNREGRILGAQAIGKEGVDKRIDVIATIMRLNGTVADLRDAELCYAPPYSSAKDPINLMGMAIENALQGLVRPTFNMDFEKMTVVDVRPQIAYEREHVPGAINIPAAQIRQRMNELPKDKPLLIHCFKGYTSYVVARILMQNGFTNVLSYAGGWMFYQSQKEEN